MTLEYENSLASHIASSKLMFPSPCIPWLSHVPYALVLNGNLWEMVGPKQGFLIECSGQAKMRKV